MATKKQNSKSFWWWIVGGIVAIVVLIISLFFIRKSKLKKIDTGSSSSKDRDTSGLTRGIRNNNPLNIRIGNDWKGEATTKTDEKDFEVFEHQKWGFRAAVKLFRTYAQKYNITTIKMIIERWAPSGDGNNPTTYLNNVSKIMANDNFNIDNTTVLDLNNDAMLSSLMFAMAIQENGYDMEFKIDRKAIIEGIELAK